MRKGSTRGRDHATAVGGGGAGLGARGHGRRHAPGGMRASGQGECRAWCDGRISEPGVCEGSAPSVRAVSSYRMHGVVYTGWAWA